MKKVAITGMGIISAIGNDSEENFNALIQKKTGIAALQNVASVFTHKLKAGEVKKTNSDLIAQLRLPEDNSYTRTALLGAYAAKQAMQNAGIEDINEYTTGLISSTSVGGMDFTEKHFFEYFEDSSLDKYITSHDAGDTSNKIAAYLGIKGYVSTISTACSSAANAIMLGARLINAGKLDRVIVGGTDALSKFTINGFNTLMILSDDYNKPFDDERNGLNLGEAAAYLVLESEESVRQSQKKILAYVSGFANANDAFHQTASSENGEGAYLAMDKALKVAQLNEESVDYVNVHGTATPNNDLSEGRALVRLFKEKVPDFSSTKAYTGHTLAAAAAIEAVYCVLALQHGVVYPNLHFKTPMKEIPLIPNTELKQKQIQHILSNSFGFGGNCSSIIFSKA